MKIRDFKRGFILFLAILFSFFLISCGTGDGDSDGGGDAGGGVTPVGDAERIILAASTLTVQSNDTDSAVITATVLDGYNAIIEGIEVSFSTSAGLLSSAFQLTDDSGKAAVTFAAGEDKANQPVTVTASASGITESITIQIVGSSLTMTATSNSIPENGAGTTLTITALDAAGNIVGDVPIILAASSLDGGAVSLSETLGVTDAYGVFEVEVSGTSAGSVTVTAEGLGYIESYDFTVTPEITGVLRIYSLDGEVDFDDPYTLFTNTQLTVVVDAPDTNYSNVVFATTVGTWEGGGAVVSQPINAGQAQAILSSDTAGFATVQVFYEDNPGGSTDSMTVEISRPPSEADSIVLQASAWIVQPSLENVTNTVTLTAKVTSSGQPVGKAPVAFSIVDGVGGGERISPVVVMTDSTGVAESTFESGTVSSDTKGVTVRASVIRNIPPPPPPDDIAIVIGGEGGSVAITTSTVITSAYNESIYELPMSVIVADSGGNSVPGAEVTLSVWPLAYRTGAWYYTYVVDQKVWEPYISGIFPNEDIDKDLSLGSLEDDNADGRLTPPNSAGGVVPATVVTDSNGVADFNLIFGKAYAVWIVDRISASVKVSGTETTSYLELSLPYERLEGEAGLLSNSPWPFAMANTNSRLFPYINDPDDDIYTSLAYYDGLATFEDNIYQYTGPVTDPETNTASDTITVGSGFAWPNVSFPVRIVFPTP